MVAFFLFLFLFVLVVVAFFLFLFLFVLVVVAFFLFLFFLVLVVVVAFFFVLVAVVVGFPAVAMGILEGERDRVELAGYLQDVDAVGFCRFQHVDQALFQAEPVRDDQINVVQHGGLAGRDLVVMRIGPRRQQNIDPGIPTNDIRHHVTEDGGGCDHRQPARL